MLMQNFGVTNKKQSGPVICWSSISMYEGDEGVSIMVCYGIFWSGPIDGFHSDVIKTARFYEFLFTLG